MSIAKTLGLPLAAVIILAAHSTQSFADEQVSFSFSQVENSYTQGDAGGDDGESLWDYICGLLW